MAKRVLTEAQRLAFLKGREKRMANIEKKRLEKLEQEEIKPEPEPQIIPNDEKPKQEELKPEPKPEPEYEIKPEPKTVTPPPSKPKLKRTTVQMPPAIDEDKIAAMVAEQVLKKMEESKPKPKPRKPRVAKPHSPKSEEKPTPQVNNFSWL